MTTTPPVDCHVVTHVHWDREWYRPFESYRARLVELAERVCDELDDGRMTTFHLDGQTIVLADVQALRPDLADRLAAHARAGRLTLGPWHVLADNQLVSGENLVRNLLTARRWGTRVGVLADVGYCPDTFGHPADLPRILNGFGMDTALVWRGAPDGVARFHWRSPDGSQVLAANQGYHAAEVLWAEPDGDAGRAARLKDFLTAERDRLPGGPWLLMNGGDHLAPTDPAGALAATAPSAAEQGAVLTESTLAAFFAAAREAADAGGVPLVEGPLRHRPGRLTFLLPGTFSARTYLKQANAAAQTDLERWAEPLLALHAPDDATLAAELRHAWELLLRNAPHDSICGCSVDEVHRENEVRFERVRQTADHLVLRALGAAGLDTRYGDPETERAAFAVLNPHPRPHTGPVTVELLTAPGRHPQSLTGPDGAPVPFEAELLGEETAFEADLDLLPDSRPALRHRLHLLAADVPALGHAVHTVVLGDTPRPDAGATVEEGVRTLPLADGATLTARDDAALTLRLPDGTELPGLAALLDDGDRGDTYNFDPVPHDAPRAPRLLAARRRTSAVRTVLELDAVIELPTGLTADRAARSADTVEVPLTVTVAHWPGHDGPLRWNLTFENTADDHRLRVHFPTPAPSARWSADTHYSLLDHPVGPDLGPLPTERAHEAEYGCVPVQSVSAIGDGELRIAVAAAGLPERTGLAAGFSPSGQDELVVTLLRSVGWLSRFDLNARTTGAGPMMATPEAQCRRRHSFDLALAVGAPVAADADMVGLAEAATVPLRAAQLRPGTAPAATGAPGLRVRGARMTALKGAEDGNGLVLRLSNPTGRRTAVEVELPEGWRAAPVRLDESPTGEPHPAGALALDLAPYALVSLRLTRL